MTDNGNTFDLTSQFLVFPVPSEPAGYTGVYTNGEVYADVAARLLDITQVTNWAYGGARAAEDRTAATQYAGLPQSATADPSALDVRVDLVGQFESFRLATDPDDDRRETAASLLIGLNDYNAFAPTNPEDPLPEALALLDSVVSRTLFAAEMLIENGVGTIILNTLPLNSFFPFSSQLAEEDLQFGAQILQAHNETLRLAAEAYSASGLDVRIVDFEAMSSEVVMDPTAFGFTAPLATFRLFGSGPPFYRRQPERSCRCGSDEPRVRRLCG